MTDQARSIRIAVSEVFSESASFKCGWHAGNNFEVKFPVGWSDARRAMASKDWFSIIQCRTKAAQDVRWPSFLLKYSQDAAFFDYVRGLEPLLPEISLYRRMAHHCLFSASSTAEGAHSRIKAIQGQKKRLSEVVEATLKVEEQQFLSHAAAEAEAIRSFSSNHISVTASRKLNKLIEDLQKYVTHHPISKIRELISKGLLDLDLVELNREQAIQLVNLSVSSLAFLGSDLGYCQDLPPEVIDMIYGFSENTRCFRVSSTSLPLGILPPSSHLVVYDSAKFVYLCSCSLPSVQGLLCKHFLKVFQSTSRVFAHHKMIHPRWFLSPRCIDLPIRPRDSEGKPPTNALGAEIPVTMDIQEHFTSEMRSLYGAISTGAVAINPGTHLSEETVQRRQEELQAELQRLHAAVTAHIATPGPIFPLIRARIRELTDRIQAGGEVSLMSLPPTRAETDERRRKARAAYDANHRRR